MLKELLIKDLIDNELSANEEDTATFNRLQGTMERFGLLEFPIVKEQPDGKYRIIGGHHKVRSWKALGNTTIQAVVLDVDFDGPEDEFNLVNSLNTIRGTMQKRTLVKIIRNKGLNPAKLDVYRFPTKQLIPSMSDDIKRQSEEAKRKAKISGLTLEIAGQLAEILQEERDELITFLVVKDKPVAILRIPFKSNQEARENAPYLKEKIKAAIQEGVGELDAEAT